MLTISIYPLYSSLTLYLMLPGSIVRFYITGYNQRRKLVIMCARFFFWKKIIKRKRFFSVWLVLLSFGPKRIIFAIALVFSVICVIRHCARFIRFISRRPIMALDADGRLSLHIMCIVVYKFIQNDINTDVI